MKKNIATVVCVLVTWILNAQTVYTSNLIYNTGDGNNWYLNGTGNGPAIMLRQNAGAGGPTNRRGSLGWMDNNGVKTEFLTWTDGAFLGIGTTTPSSLLHIEGNSGNGIYATVSNTYSSGDNKAGINFKNNYSGNTYNSYIYSDWYGQGMVFQTPRDLNNSQGGFEFWNTSGSASMVIRTSSGNVGIGTTNPTQLLSVAGNIQSKKLIVTQTGWSDYVFYKSYKLRPLLDVAAFIKINKHLPDIPTTKEVQEDGIDVGKTEALLLKKIEELTLYLIDQQKQINDLKKELERNHKNQ